MNKKERQKLIQASLTYPQVDNRQYSLMIRHLDCGSCNACEMELNALTNSIYDVEQYGISFEASPRHADILAMTGPYTRGLDEAAKSTLEAMPVQRILAVGDCTKNGGAFQNTYAVIEPPAEFKQAIIQHVTGCPPSPNVLLHALLELAENISSTAKSSGGNSSTQKDLLSI
jgi:Ni,Fe-hydrogenase III small subunit